MDDQDSKDCSQDEFVSEFSKHSRRIYSFIITLVVFQQDADDVFQNTSLALWKKSSDFTPGTSFWAWACQVAYYEVLRFRKQTRKRVVFSDEVLEQMATSMLSREQEVSILEQSLRDCLGKLDEQDRTMVELRYYHEKAPKQIAELQSRSVHSIYRALSRIHDLLHRCVHRLSRGDAK
ncbi:sigma-70 family RNA polymerase sigma factor [Aeoliella sp.]|uniref:sigma-70 family RNA polymerase sigma factor n=1 Tax=Aeoliella sp. TaxID=2795800 RepID=UPI003CCB7A52